MMHLTDQEMAKEEIAATYIIHESPIPSRNVDLP